MKPPKLLFPSILLLLYTRLNLLPNVIGSKLPSTTSGNIESFPRSAIVSSRSELGAVGYKEDRHSRSASTAVGSYTAAASTTSAAQVSRRNDDLWYLEQSVPGPPMPYQFGYEVRDPYGNEQYRKEQSDGRAVTGSYGYWGPDGIYRHVDYIADHNGYRANIRTSEPGTANENPASVTINSMPVTGGIPPTRRAFNPGPVSYPPPPPSSGYPSLPPAPPSPSLPLPTPRYTPPQSLPPPTSGPSYSRPPVTPNSPGGKTSNPKPAAPIDWSRKTVTQQKTDTEFRKRTSSSSDSGNLPPTPVITGREIVTQSPRTENISNPKPSPRSDPPNLPSSPISSYDFGRGDKPRVRLYATGGPLPGIRSVEDPKGIQQMYEFIRSELMAREKLRIMHRTNDETLRAGVAYAPESAEVSSAPTDSTLSSHDSTTSRHDSTPSSHDSRPESEEIYSIQVDHGTLTNSNRRERLSSVPGERESTVPVSTRFMYNFPKVVDPAPIPIPSMPPSTHRSLPLVVHPERRTDPGKLETNTDRRRDDYEERISESERRKTESERRKTESERRKTESERRKTESERRAHTDSYPKPSATIDPPPPSTVSRQSYSLPTQPDIIVHHNLPPQNQQQPKSPSNDSPDRRGYLYQPLPVTRSHLIIHSNEQKSNNQQPSLTHEEPALTTHDRLAIQEVKNTTSARYPIIPMSKRDFTISYPSSYRYASHQFMNLMPRKMVPSQRAKDDSGERGVQGDDHPGNEVKLKATVEVKDHPSPHVPEVVVGRWVGSRERVNGDGPYGDRVASNAPSVDELKHVTYRSPDCKDDDIMHRESTSPQTLAPETSTTTVTTEPPPSSFPSLPQAAALTAPDPTEASNVSTDFPDYMLDDSHEVNEVGYREGDFSSSSTTSPNTETEVTISEQATSTTAASLEEENEEEDEEDDDEDDDDLSGESENGSSNSSEKEEEQGLMMKKEQPRFHEGKIRHESASLHSNLTEPVLDENDGGGSSVTDTMSHEPMTLDHPLTVESGNNDEAFIAWK